MKPKVIYTDKSLEFGKSCEDLSWNHRTSTPRRSETNEIAERAVRRVKEGTSAVLLQSGLDENWWADSMECCCCLRNVQDLLADGKAPYEKDRSFRSEQWWNIFRFLRKTSQGSANLVRKFCQEYSSGTLWLRRDSGRGRYFGCRHRRAGEHGRGRNLSSKNQCKRSIDATKGVNMVMVSLIVSDMWTVCVCVCVCATSRHSSSVALWEKLFLCLPRIFAMF